MFSSNPSINPQNLAVVNEPAMMLICRMPSRLSAGRMEYLSKEVRMVSQVKVSLRTGHLEQRRSSGMLADLV
jgi:hypothetical protein